jgi:hypothetical protein
MMDGRVRVASRLLALAGLAVVLVGCDTIREAAGITKEPPDEFAVVTKAPLVIPPEFNLKPPKPGASPTNQASATASAQEALYGDDPTVLAAGMPKTYSEVEKQFLIKTGGATADHSVRQQIEAENKQMEASDETFTDKVLFRTPEPDQGKSVDADAEAQRIGDAKAQGKATTPPPADQPASEKKPDETPTIKKEEDSGWLDGILGGIF